ncbi:transcription activator GutR [Echria macrotheca]|uniref:Transcription activator GutR n=1 Tax=Echria macrotheca TaxID=438768 RepID=A0AAJ0B1U0_9PEZI|nr:transcription activator GutR [Echria macrotheca]
MMAPETTRSRKDQEKSGIRAKAPLAAQFEDCIQASLRLTDLLHANRPYSDDLRDLAHRFTERLRRWGNDSGASCRALDYTLRCSPDVVRQTHTLLKDLLRVLSSAATVVRPVIDENDDNLGNSTTPGEDEETDVDAGPVRYLNEAFDIVVCLSGLLRIYRAPADEQEHEAGVNPDLDEYSPTWYIQTARDLFPEAAPDLCDRLGNNNWRRRQYLLRLEDRYKMAVEAATSAVAPASPVQHRTGAPSLARPGRNSASASSRRSSRQADASSDGSTSSSSAATQVTSILVSSGAPSSDRNSAGSSSQTGASHPPAIQQRLILPQPPVDLEKVDQFDCPYCHFELPLNVSGNRMTLDEWTDHFYLDLRPYMCTFRDCAWGDTMFDTRQDWFRHELDFHRSRTVWSCGACQVEFGTQGEFFEHVMDSHPQVSKESILALAEDCRRYSTDLPSLDCHLCGDTCDDLEHLESHICDHLELFALAATLDHGVTVSDGMDPGTYNNIREYLDDLASVGDELPATEAQTLRAGSPGLRPTYDAGDKASGIVGPRRLTGSEKEARRQQNVSRAVDEKVRAFIGDQGDPRLAQGPVRSNVPERNSTFLGRVDSLARIHDILNTSLSTPGRICVITGRGGIGKTATAVEYLHQHTKEYPYIFWVDAENPGTRQEMYNKIADVFDTSDGPLSDEGNRAYLVREWLVRVERRWLLVFDNVGKWADISRLVPNSLAHSKGSVLITTQLPSLGIPTWRGAGTVALEPWSLEHSREFLLTSIWPKLKGEDLESHEEYELAEKVVDVVERLPLAVSMVVGYIRVARCNLTEFLEMWDERESSRRPRKRHLASQEPAVLGTIDSLWEIGIREVRANCRKLLDVMSFFHPDAIPMDLLVGPHEEEYLDFLHVDEPRRYKRMIDQLQRQRLITVKEVDGQIAYNIHRVLKSKIQNDMDDYGFADAFRKAFRLIRKAFPRTDATQVPVPEEMEICRRYMPHLDSFHKIFHERTSNHGLFPMGDTQPMQLAQLFYDAGFYVYGSAGTAYDGLPFMETAEKILDDINAPQDIKIRADIHSITGILNLYTSGPTRAKATERLKQAWDIRGKIWKEDPSLDNDILYQNAANDYSLCLMNMYRFEETAKIIKGYFSRFQEWGPESENPFEYSKFYGNNSAVLLWEGKVEEAKWFIERSLALSEKFAGRKALYYRRRFWLACIMMQTDEVQTALEIHLEVLNARLELHGKLHENTIMSLYAVGAAFHELGELEKAINQIRLCIKEAKSSRWSPEALARAQYHLALLYEEQGGNEEEAKTLRGQGEKVLNEVRDYAPPPIRDSGDNMMIFDDMQSTFWGRYTGRKLFKFMQEQAKLGKI